jgi:hypothetical protein
MSKPLFHDIIPPDRKSIKRIPIPERGNPERPMREPLPPLREKPQQSYQPPQPRQERSYSEPARQQNQQRPYRTTEEPLSRLPEKVVYKPRRRSKLPIILSILALILIAGIVFFFLPKATGATVKLTPRGQLISVDASFTGSQDANKPLPYQVALYEKDGKLTVPAGGDEHVETKATGVIRIFNNFSSDPQKLIENTRFETPNGLIFKINQAVTVPGKSGDTPGSIDVAVTAEKIGANYNVGLSDFTIPGFKNDPRYTKIIAHSKTAIAGGFAGNQKKVDPVQVKAAQQKIRDELQLSLIRQMQQNLPENFVFLPGAYFIEYESLPNTDISGGMQLTERATFHGVMFNRHDLAKVITEKVKGDKNSQNDIFGVENLAFTAKTGSSTKPWESPSLNFSLKGTTTLVSIIDTEKLKEELVAKPRNSLNAVLTSYPGVAKAQVIMRPFWKQSFPSDMSEITIDVMKEPLRE